MGRLASLNPRSTQGKADPEQIALARLQQEVEQMSAVEYERWIRTFPAAPGLTLDETRAQVRQMTRPFCTFTVEALREKRLNKEAQQRMWRERALQIARRDA